MRPEIFTCKWWRQWSKFMKDLETIKPWKTFGRSSVCLVFKRLLAMTFWIRILAFCVGKMFVKLAFSLCISLLGALRYIRRTQKCRGQNDSWLVFPCLINFDYSMSSSLLWCWPLWYQNFQTFFREIHFSQKNSWKWIDEKFREISRNFSVKFIFHKKILENDFTKILGRIVAKKHNFRILLQSVSVVVVCWKMNLSSQNFCCQSSRCFYFSHFSLLIKVNSETKIPPIFSTYMKENLAQQLLFKKKNFIMNS